MRVRGFNKTVHRFDFENLAPHDFERLVFAFLCRRWAWDSIDWYGQVGDDGGRDIIGVRDDQYGHKQTVVAACANWRNLTANKALGDLNKIAAASPRPNRVMFFAGGNVSADLKSKVSVHAKTLGIYNVEIWSGAEFEEQLRAYAETVAARFFRGEELPDEAAALRAFVVATPASEQEGLRLVARLFDRPAFQTRFEEESSLPAFKQALNNTIEALNTGLWRTREGMLIGRVPSKDDFADANTRAALAASVVRIVKLRTAFEDFQREGRIKPCSCAAAECPTTMIDPLAAHELNRLRFELLDELRHVLSDIKVAPGLEPVP